MKGIVWKKPSPMAGLDEITVADDKEVTLPATTKLLR
jgi:hypothetical protein